MRRALFLPGVPALSACDGPAEPRDAALAGRWLYRGTVDVTADHPANPQATVRVHGAFDAPVTPSPAS